MKVVLVTNILVSGLLNPYGAPGRIMRIAAAGGIRMLVDARILAEYETVLGREKFGFDPEKISILLERIERTGVTVASLSSRVDITDEGDRMFLEVALTGMADCLVTGNARHFPKSKCKGMPVLSPAAFLRLLEK